MSLATMSAWYPQSSTYKGLKRLQHKPDGLRIRINNSRKMCL
jgi:hypothetical protein